jgi:outer membrane biosynthesis protein TonB
MMTKTSSQSTTLLKKIALVPLLAAITLCTCVKTIAQVKTKETIKESQQKKTNLNEVWKDAVFIFRDANKKIIAQKKYDELTEKEKNNIPPPPPPALKVSKQNDSKSKIVKIEMTSNGPKMSSKVAGNQAQSNSVAPPSPAVNNLNKKNIKVKSKDENAVYNTSGLNEKPDYPGGMLAFYKFVGEKFQVPQEAIDNKIKGKVYATFIVEKDGSLSNIKILRDVGHGTGDEVIRVLKMCPNWTAGKIDNEAVRVLFSLPITVKTAG